MKKKLFVVAMFLGIGFGFPDINAQSLIIRQKSGTEYPELLSSVRKLTFSASEMSVVFKTGSTDVYGLSEIQKLYFDTETNAAETITDGNGKLSIYPNPADNRIVIRNIPKGTTMINIYRTDGSLLMQQPVLFETETLDVSNLQSGLYLIVANGRSAKFIRL
ncbi:MAG: T9SS type A sorting domain-containing protein [Lentimicrobium sp.]